MTPKDLSARTILARLTLMRELLDDLDMVGTPSAGDLQDDRLRRRALERILTQLVDLASDINQHAASTLSGDLASDYRETFDAAARLGMIPTSLAEKLKPSVGMRNALVHEYVTIDLDLVASAVPVARDQYGSYVRHVAQWLSEPRP